MVPVRSHGGRYGTLPAEMNGIAIVIESANGTVTVTVTVTAATATVIVKGSGIENESESESGAAMRMGLGAAVGGRNVSALEDMSESVAAAVMLVRAAAMARVTNHLGKSYVGGAVLVKRIVDGSDANVMRD